MILLRQHNRFTLWLLYVKFFVNYLLKIFFLIDETITKYQSHIILNKQNQYHYYKSRLLSNCITLISLCFGCLAQTIKYGFLYFFVLENLKILRDTSDRIQMCLHLLSDNRISVWILVGANDISIVLCTNVQIDKSIQYMSYLYMKLEHKRYQYPNIFFMKYYKSYSLLKSL